MATLRLHACGREGCLVVLYGPFQGHYSMHAGGWLQRVDCDFTLYLPRSATVYLSDQEDINSYSEAEADLLRALLELGAGRYPFIHEETHAG